MAENATVEFHNKPEEILVFKFIESMENKLAAKDIYGYYVYFDAAFHMMLNYLPVEMKQALQAEYEEYQKKLYEIKTTKKNESTRDKEILELKEDFADKHKIFVYVALQHRGWQKPQIDGELDFKELTPEQAAILIRGNEPLEEKKVIL